VPGPKGPEGLKGLVLFGGDGGRGREVELVAKIPTQLTQHGFVNVAILFILVADTKDETFTRFKFAQIVFEDLEATEDVGDRRAMADPEDILGAEEWAGLGHERLRVCWGTARIGTMGAKRG